MQRLDRPFTTVRVPEIWVGGPKWTGKAREIALGREIPVKGRMRGTSSTPRNSRQWKQPLCRGFVFMQLRNASYTLDFVRLESPIWAYLHFRSAPEDWLTHFPFR